MGRVSSGTDRRRRGLPARARRAIVWLSALAGVPALAQTDPFQLGQTGTAAQTSDTARGSSLPAQAYYPSPPATQRAQAAADTEVATAGQGMTVSNIGTVSGSGAAPPATRYEAPGEAARPRYVPSEFETFVSKVADAPIRRLGVNLLVPGARDFTSPPTTLVPPDYRLNPGDELVIGLAGPVRADALTLTVDSEGRIFIPNVGPVTVGGVAYGDVRAAIEQRVSRVYRNFTLNVVAGRLHGITVYVTGFAALPGSYTISSLSTLVNAVLAAGGPSAGGSFRSIQVRRGGTLVTDFDLYDLLLRGDKRGDVPLQNGDVIFVAPVGPQVGVIGSVNAQAIYEARPSDTLASVLDYAGGVNTVADDGRLLVLDPIAARGGWQQIAAADVAGRAVRRGEVLRVLSNLDIAKPLEQLPVLVTVSGEVARPGRYYFRPGVRMSEVVAQAGGLTAGAFPFASVVTRERLRQQQRESFAEAIRSVDLTLTAGPLTDATRTRSLQETDALALRTLVSEMRDHMPDGRIVLDLPVAAPSLPGDLVMENNDTVYVPPRPTAVGVFGMVSSAASFTFDGALTIGDYVRKAGGVTRLGDRGAIFVVRANGALVGARRGLFGGSVLGQRALPGDLVYVPINPDRGIAWTRFKDVATTLLGVGVSAAAINGLSH